MARSLRRPERGAAAVEFALVMPIFFVLIFAVVQYAWYFYVAENASSAASNVTRRLAVGDCWTGTEALDFVKGQAPQVTSAASTPSAMPTDVGDTFTVVVTADADILGFVPLPDGGVVTRTVEARLEDSTAGACA